MRLSWSFAEEVLSLTVDKKMRFTTTSKTLPRQNKRSEMILLHVQALILNCNSRYAAFMKKL